MQDDITKCLGLVKQYNPHTVAPGALIKADNCVILRENIVEDRRGYAVYGTLSNNPTQLMGYLGRVLAHNGTTVSYDNGSGTFANYSGSYSAPTGKKMHFVEAYSNLYCTTSLGIQVFTDVAGTAARKAGAPRSLDPSYTLPGAGSGFLAAGSQCAYRIVIQRTDANSNVLLGYPSTRLWVANTGGSADNVTIVLYLPSEVTTADVVQVYRTEQVVGTTTDIAGDEMSLVYQVSPASADIIAGSMSFVDSVIDALRGASLYTNSSQEGISQANARPPLAKDIAQYKNDYIMYANCSTPQRLQFSLVGWSALYNAGAYGRSIVLAGTTYTFKASENASLGEVKVSHSGGTDSTYIDETARSLVRVINRYATNTSVYAYYLSGPDDLPGQILIEERSVGGAVYGLSASNTAAAGMFFPAPPTSPPSTGLSASSNSIQKNAVYYSKSKQPEAVPLLNYALVGSANKNILRIAPLRDSLIIIKEEGVFILRGDTPPFTVTPLDLTVFCKAEDSVAVLSNQVLMLSNQGVVAIGEAGATVISREIEPELKPLLTYTGLSTATTGLGYESDRSYLLSTITASTDTVQNQIYIYNIFTKTWVHWTFGFNAAIIEPTTDKLFFAKPSVVSVYRERKSFDTTDYADPESSITITALSGTSVTFTISGATPAVGWVIAQGGTEIALSSVTSNSSGYSAVLASTPPSSWTTGAATIYPSVGMELIWDAWTANSPGTLKRVREFFIFADNIPGNNSATALYATFKSNFDEEQDQIPIVIPGGGWGGAWGAIPWGGSGDGYGYRTYVPRNKVVCRIMNAGLLHQSARERLSVAGCGYVFDPISERISK